MCRFIFALIILSRGAIVMRSNMKSTVAKTVLDFSWLLTITMNSIIRPHFVFSFLIFFLRGGVGVPPWQNLNGISWSSRLRHSSISTDSLSFWDNLVWTTKRMKCSNSLFSFLSFASVFKKIRGLIVWRCQWRHFLKRSSQTCFWRENQEENHSGWQKVTEVRNSSKLLLGA